MQYSTYLFNILLFVVDILLKYVVYCIHYKKPNNKTPSKEKNEQLKNKDEQSKQATEQWLRRIPDDPGGLLRNKFLYQYKQQQHSNEDNAW